MMYPNIAKPNAVGALPPPVEAVREYTMPALDSAVMTLALAVAVAVLGIYLACHWPRIARFRPQSGIIERAPAPHDVPGPQIRVTHLLMAVSHSAPSRSFSIEQAHLIMQQHLSCSAESCPCKRSAFRTLIEAGKMIPDLRVERCRILG